MKKLHLIAALSAFGMFGMGSVGFDWDRFLNALQRVESGGEKNPDQAVGDNGNALGRYQLWRNYVKDAKEFDKTLTQDYRTIATDKELAGKAVVSYLTRYGKKHIANDDVESLARVHNGGPAGHKKKATDGYAKKFMREYNR